MAFVCSRLTGGLRLFTPSQAALNDTLMVFAVVPSRGAAAERSAIVVPRATRITSVMLLVVRWANQSKGWYDAGAAAAWRSARHPAR